MSEAESHSKYKAEGDNSVLACEIRVADSYQLGTT